jgi:hypothetical protein
MQKYAQYSIVLQEFSSSNAIIVLPKTTKKGGWGRKTHNIFTQSQPHSLKLSYNMKKRPLYPTKLLVSLSLYNDHRCDGGHCAKTTTPTPTAGTLYNDHRCDGVQSFFACSFFVFDNSHFFDLSSTTATVIAEIFNKVNILHMKNKC